MQFILAIINMNKCIPKVKYIFFLSIGHHKESIFLTTFYHIQIRTIQLLIFTEKFSPLLGFEPGTSPVPSRYATNWAILAWITSLVFFSSDFLSIYEHPYCKWLKIQILGQKKQITIQALDLIYYYFLNPRYIECIRTSKLNK